MKHALKPTLTAMFLVPALTLGAAGMAAAQATGNTPSAQRANRADPTSAVTHAQAMRSPANGSGSPAAAATEASAARNDAAHASTASSTQASGRHDMARANESDPKMYIFDALDTNHDGKLSRAEVAHDSKLARQARALDRNRDGNVSRDEFAGYKR